MTDKAIEVAAASQVNDESVFTKDRICALIRISEAIVTGLKGIN